VDEYLVPSTQYPVKPVCPELEPKKRTNNF